VLFSSVSSVLGSACQANHAAANAYLDGLARFRQVQGRPALSINWGPWSGIGAAARRAVDQRSDLAGIGLITPEEGMELLESALVSGMSQLAAVRLDLGQFPARWRERSLFEFLTQPLTSGAASTGESLTMQQSPFLLTYWAAPAGERRGLLLSQLQTLVARTLGMADSQSVPTDQALSDLGLDSLASLELCNNLEESLHTPIPSTLVYDYPTLANMADFFLALLEPTDPASHTNSAPPDANTPASPGDQRAVDEIHLAGAQRAEDPNVDAAADTTHVLQGMRDLCEELSRWEEV
jgi:acyl carrier protein